MIASNRRSDLRVDPEDRCGAPSQFQASRLSAPTPASSPDPLKMLRHELCTPLNAILGFSDLLAGNEQLSERHRRYAANILASGTVLLRRINSLLEQARIEGDVS
jgi:K+-sensing histidine kinase KdpD